MNLKQRIEEITKEAGLEICETTAQLIADILKEIELDEEKIIIIITNEILAQYSEMLDGKRANIKKDGKRANIKKLAKAIIQSDMWKDMKEKCR